MTGALKTNGATPKLMREPLVYSGSLDHLKYFEVTPLVGREYPDVQLSEIYNSPNAEVMIKDLAIITSQRGVLFFRNQEMPIPEQKALCDSLGRLSGRPEGHGLHPHPLFNSPDNSTLDEKGTTDKEIYVISSESQAKLYKHMKYRAAATAYKDSSNQWHTDCTFEVCPADYSLLKLHETPNGGGDTMFASSTEVYERMSPSFRAYLETLTATCAQPVFKTTADLGGYPVLEPRGSPLNVGDTFAPSHPVVRTNPITGYKSIFAVGLHVSKINDVSPVEDEMIREYILRILTRNHDLQCRIRWEPNSVALWDNRSVYHAATPDLNILGGKRTGNRASSIGEVPYFDPASTTRSEALAAKEK